jgi:hypothetical protein
LRFEFDVLSLGLIRRTKGEIMQRDFVEKEELIYTCNCGWVDTGHANPTSRSFGTGAQSLWDQITTQNGSSSKAEDGFKVTYRQSMSGTIPVVGIRLTDGVGGDFFVARNLSRGEQESVALGIFLHVSYEFEKLQGSYLIPRVSSSSFSVEDIVSNVLGFYQVVRGTNWRNECSVVSKKAALQVFDTYKNQINSTKVGTVSPVFFDCVDCKKRPSFPSVFKSINVLSPRMDRNVVNRVLQYGAKSRKWLPIDDARYN